MSSNLEIEFNYINCLLKSKNLDASVVTTYLFDAFLKANEQTDFEQIVANVGLL